nr:hypothetical protein [Tanacetum cinerariifolium]
MNQQREQETLLAVQREQELREQEQATQEKEEPPQNSEFRQLIGEMCGTKVCEAQKQNMEDTMLEFLKDCGQKELYCMHNDVDDLIESAKRKNHHKTPNFVNLLEKWLYCMHNDVDDLIESALNSKLLLINLKSQRLDKEKQEVKNIVEQPTKRRIRITESLQNLRGELSSVAMEAILGEPRVYVPNVLPTQPTLYHDSDFFSSNDSRGSGHEVSFPSGTRNKIFDSGIFIKV